MIYNLAFYTCFYGSDNNPAFKIPLVPSLNYKCYYFTNNKKLLNLIKNTKWIGIYDEKGNTINDDDIQSCMNGKHVKICPQEYTILKEYDYLCFLDSKLQKINEKLIENFIQKYFIKDNFALLLRKHWFVKPNIWSEYNESMIQLRYKKHEEQYKSYINNQLNNGLDETTLFHCACGLLIRNMKHPETNNINNTWYKHVEECGIQDQISFFFVKQLFKGFIFPFTEIPFL